MARMLLAAFFLSLCCFHYPAGSAMPQTTAYNRKFFCVPPRQDQPYSEALQPYSEALPPYSETLPHFLQIQQLLEYSVLFARQLGLSAERTP